MSNPRILVGIDFSAESELAARQAFDIAHRVGGELVLAHADTVTDMPPFSRDMPEASLRALERYASFLKERFAQDRARLGEMRRRLAGAGVTVLEAAIEGYPDTGLATAAHELGAELTVVGTHGRTGLKWFELGSVSQRVIRLCESDVLVARKEGVAAGGYRKVFVATDFSSSAARALERAMWLAAPDAEIDVVHFYHHHPSAGLHDAVQATIGADVDQQVMEELRAAGQSFIGQRRGSGPTVRFYAVAEPAIPGIVHWLERQSYDLAALGSHGRRGFRRFVLGSVAEAVARRAPCSTLVAHGGPGGGGES